MNKIGNKHCSLLDEMTKVAQTEKKEFVPDILIEALKKEKKPTLTELFAQFEEDMAGPPIGAGPPMDEEVMPETDTEGAKRGLCEALKALCGSLEDAHACLDQFCGEEQMLDEGGIPGEENPMGGPAGVQTSPAPMAMPSSI